MHFYKIIINTGLKLKLEITRPIDGNEDTRKVF